MSKEHLYIHDSEAKPPPISAAQQAFFRYQFSLGTYEYAEHHGTPGQAQALLHQLHERYEEYRALQDDIDPLSSPGQPAPQVSPTSGLERSPRRKARRSPKSQDLSPALRDTLLAQESACLLEYSPRGTVAILKTQGAELATIQAHTVIRVSHDLHSRPTAPVIRSLFQWYVQSDSARRFEAFTDVADEHQRADYRRLAGQQQFNLLAYNEQLELVLQRRINNTQGREMTKIAELADRLRDLIPAEHYDFALAKEQVMSRNYERA